MKSAKTWIGLLAACFLAAGVMSAWADTVAPTATGLRIEPDLGESATDGVTCEASLTVRGTLAADTAQVTVLARRDGQELTLAPPFAPSGTNLTCAVTLPGAGAWSLVVRCVDSEGNEAETTMDVLLDAVPVTAAWDAVPSGTTAERAVLRFSEPVIATDVAPERFFLTRNGAALTQTKVSVTARDGGLAFDVRICDVSTALRLQSFETWKAGVVYTNKTGEGWTYNNGLVQVRSGDDSKSLRLGKMAGDYLMSPALEGIGILTFDAAAYSSAHSPKFHVEFSTDGKSWKTLQTYSLSGADTTLTSYSLSVQHEGTAYIRVVMDVAKLAVFDNFIVGMYNEAEPGTNVVHFDGEGVRKASSGLPMGAGTVATEWTGQLIPVDGDGEEDVDGVTLYYTISNGVATVTGASPANGDLVIPSVLGSSPVENIGYEAFSYCTNLMSVTIGDGVTSIGSYAFEGCSGLTSVTIPDSVTYIGAYAFYYCSGLTSVTIGDSVTSIGSRAFSGCSGLMAFSVADVNPAYQAVSGLLLTKDGKELLFGVNGNVVIPDSVTSIVNDAFYSCRGLTSVTLPNSVMNIGNSAFEYCHSLTNVVLGAGVTNIGGAAFSYCTNLMSVSIPDSVTSIGSRAFDGCSGLTNVALGAGVTNIGSYAFSYCSGLNAFSVASGNPAYQSATGLLLTKDGATLVGGVNGDVVIPASVTSIGDGAFSGCSGLTSVTIPASVTYIGADAFYYCSGLTSMTIPASVTSIGDGAFSGCSGLMAFSVADANPAYQAVSGLLLTKDGKELLFGVNGNVVIPDSVTSIGNRAFFGCSGLTSVAIPNSVTSIGYRAFSGCRGLTSVTIPDSVTNIGEYAFYYCTGLTSVAIPDSVTSIGNRTFFGCGGLKMLSVPGSWEGTDMLASAGVPEGCEVLYGIRLETDILDGVTWTYSVSNGTATVRGATSEVESLTIPSLLGGVPVACIGNKAFYGCNGLTDVTIPEGVTEVGPHAFESCTRLRTVTVPASLKKAGEDAFAECTGLVAVHVQDLAAWCGIQFGNANANPLCYAGLLFVDGTEVKDLVIPESVRTIEFAAFFACSGLESVKIPGTVERIGRSAFCYCRGLNNAEICEGVQEIDTYAFAYCNAMTSVRIPDSVRTIGRYAFMECSDSIFDDAAIPGVRLVDGWAVDCSAQLSGALELTRIRGIADRTFFNCTNLQSVVIGNGVEQIGAEAFRGCSSLSSVEIASSVKDLGEGVFGECTGLATLVVPASWKGTDMLDGTGLPEGCEIVYKDAAAVQTLEWATLGSGYVPGDHVTMHATASGGGKVLFDVLSGPGVVEGNVLTFTAAGTVEVRAQQAGGASWAPVEETRTVEVSAMRDGRWAYADLAANYADGWTDGSNGGMGFGPWNVELEEGSVSGWAGLGLWNPSANGFTGLWEGKSKAFSMVGKGTGWSVAAARNFLSPLGIGDSFSLEMAVNLDSHVEGAKKGFVLTAAGQDIVTVNHENAPGEISVNGDSGYAMFNIAGLYPMTWTFVAVDATTIRFTATGRDNPENVCTGVLSVATSAIDGFRLQSANQYALDVTAAERDGRQNYYDNFRLFKETAGGTLSLELATAEAREDARGVRCVVRRSGPTGQALEVEVVSSRPGDVSVPRTMTIPAGAKSGAFMAELVDNGVVDGTRTTLLTVSAEGYEGAEAELTVLDDEVPSLTLVSGSSSLREGETLTVVVVRQLAGTEALTVNLSGLSGSRVTYPATVTIPAGAKMGEFAVTLADDETAQGEMEYTLMASAVGHTSAQWTFTALDDDVPGVTLTLHPEMVSEGAGGNAVRATLTRTDTSKQFDKAIEVRLTATPSGKVVVPEVVTIPARKEAVTFGITPVDNGQVDKGCTVTIDGAIMIPSCGCTGQPSGGDAISATLTVTDDDVPALSLKAEPATMKEGLAEAGWLVLSHNSALTENLTVTLGVDIAGEISIPATVTIPAGETSIQVPVTTLDDGVEDGTKLLTVRAEDPSGAFASAATWLQVSDQNLPDLMVAAVQADASVVAQKPLAVRFTATNAGFAACARTIPYAVHVTRSEGAALSSNTLVKTGTLTGGVSVGGTLEAELEVSAPELPGDVWVAVVLNPDGAISELDHANNTGWSAAVGVSAAYTATVSADAETYLPGDTISLAGRATLAEGGPAVGVDVDVYLLMNGMRRTLKVTTGSDGSFSTAFTPTDGEAGHYGIGACYPGAGSEAVQDEFDVLGMKRANTGNIIWDIAQGDSVTRTITLRNASATALTELAAIFEGVPEECELTWELPKTLAGNGSVAFKLTATATGVTEQIDYEKFTARIESAEGTVLEFPLYFHAQTQKAYLRATPASIDTTMAVGHERYIDVTVMNDGKGDSGPVTATVPDVPWLKIAAGTGVSNLGPGESMTVTVLVFPEADQGLELGRPFSGGSLALNCANGRGCSVPLKFTLMSEATGNLRVTATDDNTYRLASAPNLAGATVRISNRYTGATVMSGTTGADGTWTVEGLLEGTYRVTVSAANHETSEQDVAIEPGRTASAVAFLQYQLVRATWEVEKTEIEDSYDVQLVLDWETTVPAPIVTTTMPKELPELGVGDAPFAFQVILENKGVIAAEKVTLTLPVIDGYSFTLSENGVRLPAKSSKTITVILSRMKTGTSARVATTERISRKAMTGVDYLCAKEKPHYEYATIFYLGRRTTSSTTHIPNDTWVSYSSGGSSGPTRTESSWSIGTGGFSGAGSIQLRRNCDPKKNFWQSLIDSLKPIVKAVGKCGDDAVEGTLRAATPVVDAFASPLVALQLALSGCASMVDFHEPSADASQQEEAKQLAELMTDVYRNASDNVNLSIPGQRRLTQAETATLLGRTMDADEDSSVWVGSWEIMTSGAICQSGSGFKAAMYVGAGNKPTEGRLTLAFAGTELNGWEDGNADVDHYACVSTEQYDAAVSLLNLLLSRIPENRDILLVGHSLGGGLVQHAMLANNTGNRVRGVTYNAAGMCGLALAWGNGDCRQAADYVTNYRALNDPVSAVGYQLGQVLTLPGASGHSINGARQSPPDVTLVERLRWYNAAVFANAKAKGMFFKSLAGAYEAGKAVGDCVAQLQIGAMAGYKAWNADPLGAAQLDYAKLASGERPAKRSMGGRKDGVVSEAEEWAWRIQLMAHVYPALQTIRSGVWGGSVGRDEIYGLGLGETLDFPASGFAGDEWLALDPAVAEDFAMKVWLDYANGAEWGSTKMRSEAPEGISKEALDYFFARFSNTADYLLTGTEPSDGNRLRLEDIAEARRVLLEIERIALEAGYEDVGEMWDDALDKLDEYLTDNNGICASVKIELSQTVAMTREAFDGTLTLYNGNGETPIRDLKLELSVLDEEGVECRDYFEPLFLGTAGDMEGEDVLAGGMTVAAGGTGSAMVRFIPERGAAPTEEKMYRFGGTVTYLDPFSGEQATIRLTPVALTVSPSPYLHLDYFVQRDVYGDDPDTADVVEASLPAELAVLVRNVGGGEARNVTIASAQPETVQNEKGLAVDFRLSDYSLDAMALNGATAHLGLNTVNLGTIGSGESKVAQWWLTASIQGHFTGMKASVTPVNSWNTPDTSLVDTNAGVHKLIRSVEADGDGLPDFLTSEEGGLYGLADTIWTSAGVAMDVAPGSLTVSGRLATSEATLGVEMTATRAGWTYGWAAVPGAERYDVVRVTRGDGSEVSLRNVWITDRVFRDAVDPKWETRLHIADECTEGPQAYTIKLAAKPSDGPEVAGFGGVEAGAVVAASPNAVTVEFTAAVDGATFGTDDLTLWCQGRPVDDLSGLSVSGSGTHWTISGLGSVCAAPGRYELVVRTVGIAGTNGSLGMGGRSVSWTVASGEAPSVVRFDGVEDGVSVRWVGDVTVVFSVPVEGFDATALRLNGASVEGVTVTADETGTRWTVAGLDGCVSKDGSHTLTVVGLSVTGANGLPCTADASVTWVRDTTAPVATGLRIDPDQGESVTDGVTCEATVTVRATLAADTAQVTVLARRDGQELVLAKPFAPGGTNLECAVTLPTGMSSLAVRCEDAAGNESVTAMDVFVDVVPATAAWDAITDGTTVERAVLRFSAAMMSADVGLNRFSLTRDGVAVALSGVTVSPRNAGTAVELSGLGPLCSEPGAYVLRFDASGVRKASSGLPMAATTVTTTWKGPESASTESYTITIAPDIAWGTVAADKNEAREGEMVTLTVTPNDGFKLDTITVNGRTISGNTFVMPAFDVLVSASFVEKPMVARFVKITNLTNLTEGEYVITGERIAGEEYAMKASISTGSTKYIERREEAVTLEEDTVTDADEEIIWTLAQGENGWTIYNAAVGYAGYVASGKSAGAEAEASEKSSWTIAESETEGLFLLRNVGNDGRYLLYNNLAPRFACYTNLNSGKHLALYKGSSGPVALSVSFKEANPLKIEEGMASSVTAVAQGGEAPYTYKWKSETEELNATSATLTIPATLAAGTYTITVTAKDNTGNEVTKSFAVIVSVPTQKYAVTVASDIEKGTLTADKSEAGEGELVTLTATPDAGMRLSGLWVNGVALEGTTFTMPGEAVTVTAEFSSDVTWKYTVTNGVATLTGAEPAEGDLVIPSHLGGYLVTSIGIEAFLDCEGLTSVTIPGSVTSIGYSSFFYCSGLTNVTISDGVRSIEDFAFGACYGLTSVTIPASVASIGTGAFAYCNSLADIIVQMGNLVYESTDGVLFNKGKTRLIQFPGGTGGAYVISDSVTSIVRFAFSGCSGLTNVTIPESVTSIEDSAFYECSGLKRLSVPGSWKGTDMLANAGVPEGCKVVYRMASAYSSVSVPGTLEMFGAAWDPTTNLLSSCFESDWFGTITPSASSGQFKFAANTNWNINWGGGFSVLRVPAYNIGPLVQYGGNISWGNATVNASHTFIFHEDTATFDIVPESVPVRDFSTLQLVILPNWGGNEPGSTLTKSGNLWIGEIEVSGITDISFLLRVDNELWGLAGTTTSVLPVTDVSLCGSASLDVTGVQPGTLFVTFDPEKLLLSLSQQSICDLWVDPVNGAKWFYSVTNGTAIVRGVKPAEGALEIPVELGGYPVTEIASHAFGACSNLLSMTIPDWVMDIGPCAFRGCSSLTSVTIGNGVTSIGRGAFEECSSLTEVSIGKSVANIGDGAFGHCRGLTSVTIPDSVTSIGSNAFAYCSGLTSVTILGNVTNDWTWQSSPFYGCTNIATPVLGDKMTKIGDYMFEGCSGLSSVTIPDNVTIIGDNAFSNCRGLTSVTIPDSVTSIGDSAFSNCSGLTSVTIGNSVTSIESDAFYCCSGLTSVTILGNVTNDWAWQSSPFYGCTNIATLVLGDKMTKIGNNMFYGCSGLTSVTIGNSVTNIGSSAFSRCSGLTRVTIGNSVTSIGESAFRNCSGLESVTIPDGVTSIGGNAFSDCSGLTSVTIPDGVTCIGSQAFLECSGLTSVTILGNVTNDWKSESNGPFTYCTNIATLVLGDKMTKIGDYMFEGCSGLSSVTIPDNVTIIGDNAFSNCRGLTSVTIPDSVMSIGNSAFEGCSGLTSVTIPDNVTIIGCSTFSGCSGLTNVMIPECVTIIGDNAFSNCSGLTSVIIPNSVTNIGEEAFSDCYGLTRVKIGEGVEWIGYKAFANCWRLTGVTIPDRVKNTFEQFSGCVSLKWVSAPLAWSRLGVPTGVPAGAGGAGLGVERECWLLYGYRPETVDGVEWAWAKINRWDPEDPEISSVFGAIPTEGELIIPETLGGYSVSEIASYAFSMCTNMTSVSIPDSVTYIGDYAFSGCSGLTNVTIPDSVTKIGYSAFSGCSGLTSMTIGDSVTNIGWDAFFGCSGLTSVTIPDSVTSIGSGPFSACLSLNDIIVAPGNLGYESVDGVLFNKDKTRLIQFPGGRGGTYEIPDGVTNIGYSAFSGCSGLTSVTIGDSVTSIGGSAFAYCSGLTSVTIPDGVTSIGEYAFSGCSGLTSMTIGNSVTKIGYSAFSGCSGLTNVTIPDSVTSIGGEAFSGCSGLTSVTIGNSVTSIGSSAFYYCSGLTSVTIGDSVTSIGDYAFSYCRGLTNVTIPNSVTSIGTGAFFVCSGLKTLSVPGSWEGTDMLTNAGVPEGCEVVFRSDEQMDKPVIVTSSPLPDALYYNNTSYSNTLVVTGATNVFISSGASAISGLGIVGSNPSWALAGIPTTQGDNLEFTVTAQNSVGSTSSNFTITIHGPPVWQTPNNLPTAHLGQPYETVVWAKWGDSYVRQSGSLPAGLAMSTRNREDGWKECVISGTPTATADAQKLQLRAENAYDPTTLRTLRTFTLTVSEEEPVLEEVKVMGFSVNAGSVALTLSDGSTTSDGLQYSTDLKTWTTNAVDIKKAASVFIRLGEPGK